MGQGRAAVALQACTAARAVFDRSESAAIFFSESERQQVLALATLSESFKFSESLSESSTWPDQTRTGGSTTKSCAKSFVVPARAEDGAHWKKCCCICANCGWPMPWFGACIVIIGIGIGAICGIPGPGPYCGGPCPYCGGPCPY